MFIGTQRNGLMLTTQVKKSCASVPLSYSVQRKLRWVECRANRWVLALDRCAGHYFVLLVVPHLMSVITAQLIGKFRNHGWSNTNNEASIILECNLQLIIIDAALFPTLIGEVGQTCNAKKKILRIFFCSQRFAYKQRINCSNSNGAA